MSVSHHYHNCSTSSTASATTSYDYDYDFDYRPRHPDHHQSYTHNRYRQRQSTPAISSSTSTTYRDLSVHVDREPHTSLPPSLENHPFCRGLSSIDTMGQAQTKGSTGLEVCPSTGPDPTIFRQHSRFPNVQIAQPTSIPSAPMVPTRTDETLSRIDYTPSPPPTGSANSRSFGLPRPAMGMNMGGFGSKSKGLTRKLSRKAVPAPIVTKKSMGPDPFEARPFSPMPPMEDMEGLKSQQAMMEEYGIKTAKAGSFPNRQGQSPAQVEVSGPRPPVPFPTSVNVNTPQGPITPTQPTAPGVHRRVTSMSRSPRASIRSSPSKRAEREWRAKVAGLAHTHRGGVETRGPVPPRRIVAQPPLPGSSSERDRSSSPEEENVVTPTNSVPAISMLQQQENTPAKSFTSNRSFETLGHYAHLSPTRANGPSAMAPLDPGPRQCSVPQSVVSSFYFDQRASRVSTHLSPLVTNSATLSPIPSSHSPESPIPNHKAGLPNFSSFLLSPASVGPPPSPTPNPQASPMVYPVRSESDSVPPLLLSKGSSSHSRRHHLSMQTDFPPLSPGPKTPVRQTRPVTISTPKSSVPGTPYSPTTAYILQTDQVDHHLFAAPGELDLSRSYSGDQLSAISTSRGAQRHPYARTPSMLIDSPPRKPASRRVMHLCPRHDVVSPPCRHAPNMQGQSYAPDPRSRKAAKGEISGTAPLRTGASRKVDLTPGMENGMRPPKSGLSMTVSDLDFPLVPKLIRRIWKDGWLRLVLDRTGSWTGSM